MQENGLHLPRERGSFSLIFDKLEKSGDLVFCYPDTGIQPHHDSFLKPLKYAVRLAGIDKRVDLHTFRHSFGSNKIREGFGIQKVSRLLGHSDISLTSKVYAHLLDGDLRVEDALLRDKSKPSAKKELLKEVMSNEEGHAFSKMLRGCLEKLEGISRHLEVNQGQTDYLLREVEGLRKVQLSDLEDTSDTDGKALKYMDNLAGRGGGIRTHDLVVPNDWGDQVPNGFWLDTVINFLQIVLDLPEERGIKLSEVFGLTASFIEKNYCTYAA